MPPKSTISQTELKGIWKNLPASDRQFMAALIAVNEALGLKNIHYELLPPELERRLKRCNRGQLFSILAECLGLLTHAPALQRIKDEHRRRSGQRPPRRG